MKVVVTGGSGGLGQHIMRVLAERGSPGVAASRRTGVDLATGAGLREMLAGVEVIIHAASSPVRPRAVDLDGTRRMIKILQEGGSSAHLVYVSIVGCDQNPYPYYRAKHACEIALRRSGLPVTVVRATQFHSLIVSMAKGATFGPVALTVDGFTTQPCDPGWVAEQLVEVALGPPPAGFARGTDLAGPERLSATDAVVKMAAAAGKPSPRLIHVPAIGATLKAFAAGSNLPGPDARTGGSSFSDHLAAP